MFLTYLLGRLIREITLNYNKSACIQVPEITPSYTVDMAAFALASVGESVNQ